VSSHRPDPATDIQVDPLSRAGLTVRRCPTVEWTDASGAHEVTVEERLVVGSGEGVDVSVADSTVSRLHAELERRDDGLWIRDLGSTNGTFVAGVRIGLARAPDGAAVRMGATDLTVRYSPVAVPVDLWEESSFGPLIGRSVAMRELFARLSRVAATDSRVLVQGETGTGKELAARAIHEASSRASGPFVVVDCASLPQTLLETELFGHVRGAFTGAVAARVGSIEAAHGGTVFLDEVGELPPAMQPRVLRVLESRAVRRVGEASWRPVDVRFVSATHRNLRSMVNRGTFREDLYFRLAVVPITIPPLRARLEDIPLLVDRFLGDARTTTGAVGPELLRDLESRPWPGNVRELRNFVERAVAFGTEHAIALLDAPRTSPEVDPARLPIAYDRPLHEARQRLGELFEREYVRALKARHPGNMTAMAEHAGVDRAYLYRIIRRHGL